MSSLANAARNRAAKIDNNPRARPAKIEIRRNVLEALGAPAHVFDAFAGAGELYRAVWSEAASYVGCDQKYYRDERKVYVADNRRVLRAIDLAPFNLFDLDSYGSPWEQAIIIAARRKVKPGERIGLVLTEGNGLSYAGNVIPRAVAELTGLRKAVGLKKQRDAVHGKILAGLAHRFRARVERRWQAEGKTGAAVVYLGIVLIGLNDAAAPAAGSHSPAAGIPAGPS